MVSPLAAVMSALRSCVSLETAKVAAAAGTADANRQPLASSVATRCTVVRPPRAGCR